MPLYSNIKEVKAELEKELGAAQTFFFLGVKKVIFDLHAEILKRSPVDTGRFRANNFLTIGSPSTATLSQKVSKAKRKKGAKGKPLELPQFTSARQQRVAEAQATLAAAFSKGSAATGAAPVSFFITNNLPYAERLENGYSKQAPEGIYRQAEVVAEIKMKELEAAFERLKL